MAKGHDGKYPKIIPLGGKLQPRFSLATDMKSADATKRVNKCSPSPSVSVPTDTSICRTPF